MYKLAKPLFLICETPLHAGSSSDLGIVDLPIQRERHTGFPKIEGSSLKGSIREHFEQKHGFKTKEIFSVFGSEDEANSQAGAIGITDARLLLFPVKSLKGVFAWITCPRVLYKAMQDMQLYGNKEAIEVFDIEYPDLVSLNSSLLIEGKHLILEEYAFEVTKSDKVSDLGKWLANQLYDDQDSYWAKKIKTDIVVLNDDDFKDFVNLSTEVITRTKINNETGTVATGQLWTEEYLPADAIMYSLVLIGDELFNQDKTNGNGKMKKGDIDKFLSETFEQKPIMQIGGNATIGKGIVKTKFLNN